MEWIVKIGETEYKTNSIDELCQWYRTGRVRPEHYVFNPILQRWLYAREVEELRGATGAQGSYTPPAATAKSKSGCGKLLLIAVVVILAFVAISGLVDYFSRQSSPTNETSDIQKMQAIRAQKQLASLAADAPIQNVDRLCEQASAANASLSPAIRQRCAAAHLTLAEAALKKSNADDARKFVSLSRQEGADAQKVAALDASATRLEQALKEKHEREAAAIVSRMRKKIDKLEKTTWYYDPSSPEYNDANAFYLYFGEKGGEHWLRWRVQYHADDWLFIRSLTVYTDGRAWKYNPVDFERDHRADIWEWRDVSPTADDLAMIKAVIQSKEAVVRFNGAQYRADRTISAEQKHALQHVLEAFEAKGGKV